MLNIFIILLDAVYRVEALCNEPLVGSALQGRDIVMHPEMGQSLVSLHFRVMRSPL
jgi:hypothetical protein